MGWKFVGEFPDVKQCVIVVIPHTHWLDFTLGVLVRKIVGKKMHYVGKKSLFKPPFGWFFKWMGGTPVDRSKNQNMVDAIVEIFNKKEVFRFAMAPEGTRKKVETLKSGFYYIAQNAKVPLVLVAFDFGHKQVKFSEPFFTTGDYEKDMVEIKLFFENVIGKVPKYSF
ncbi:acyltransferase [Croceivirga lutea]|uniref:1-acyl-sn-glycerol-3-phosphate acyltransferase n=1 Tax=Croceivirga lutea TaxID=1775167 RepID=UPI0019B42F1C|nr:1-acyl-sn-glycerol-3-phosphate acyltransferase [Croceivirga lutea]GGG57055.1 acyltransferase [Croceivirga lutea]